MKKVVWAEGILLGQQHLQQWDHYHHGRQDFLAKLSLPFHWGIKKCVWDKDSFRYGKLMIKQCELIFPNGQIIQYDSQCEPPLIYALTAEHANVESLYMAIPISPRIKNITGYPVQQGMSGWVGEYQLVFDDEDSEREREVLFAHPNLCLLSSKEDKSPFYALKIAEVVKQNNSEFELNIKFIPACLSLETSDALMRYLGAHIELLSSKSHLLRSRRRQVRWEWMDFLLVQLFNEFLPELIFLKHSPHYPPSEFYRVLVRLIGSLTTFSHEVAIPLYDHADLTRVFAELDSCLKLLIELAIPTRTSLVKWERESEFLYTSEHIDSRVFQKSGFYVAVTMDAPVMEWLAQFTHQIKIGARSVIESIVASALTGVTLIHVQRPPHQLSVKPGYEYFYLEPKGPYWEQIKIEQTLSLFVSHDFTKAQIELLTVDEGD